MNNKNNDILIISTDDQEKLKESLKNSGTSYKVLSKEDYYKQQVIKDKDYWKISAELAGQDKERMKEIALWDTI